MTKRKKDIPSILALAAVLLGLAVAAFADGMIVPIQPEIRVRGHWAVKYHHVKITVRDQVASVHIDQEFVNTGSGMIEVEYLFPVPPDAAIDSMTLMVDGKEFAAKLLNADEARRIYEDIVRRKKDPALLEYAGFGLYRTRAFPLEPGKPCRVVVTYKSVCRKDGQLVEVWYPLNTEKFSAKPIDDVEVKADIKTAADITAVYSPSHDLKVERKDPRHVIATYHAKDALPATDFQLYYKAADEKVAATLLTWQPEERKDGYFMLLVSPSPRADERAVVAKDVVVVLDRSGSMSGKKIDQAKEALTQIVRNLNREDRFNILTYSDDVELLFDRLVEASDDRIREAADRIDRIEATGGTNIHAALLTAMKMLPPRSDRESRRPAYILFITDGKPTVGTRDEGEILRAARRANDCAARIFSFGVGYDVNVRLLDKLSDENGGKSGYVKPSEPVEAKITSLYNKIKNPVMTALKVEIEGLRLRDMYPRELGDLFEGDQIVVVGRYFGEDASRLPSRERGVYHTQLVVRGTYEGKERAFEYPVAVRPAGRDTAYGFVEKLWAIRRVGFLLDEVQLHGKSQEVIDEIIRLSKTYGIMTPYTSFLADETTVLARPTEVRRRGLDEAEKLADRTSGAAGHMDAAARSEMKRTAQVPAAAATEPGDVAGTAMIGNKDQYAYEKNQRESVANVQQVGNQAMYRRGRVWVAANASHLDAEKDKDKIQVVNRFSDEYFKLVQANTTEENQMLSTQREGEEILIALRGQAYLIR